VSRESVRKNISKWSIGGMSASQADVSRFMLMVYNPMACADIFRLHGTFRTLIEARDILAMRDEVLFDEKLPPPLFNGTRIQTYPKGGGFMTAHRDSRAAENMGRSDLMEAALSAPCRRLWIVQRHFTGDRSEQVLNQVIAKYPTVSRKEFRSISVILCDYTLPNRARGSDAIPRSVTIVR